MPRKINAGMFTSDNANWGTPTDFFLWLHGAFGFTIDVCADKKNRKLPRFWSKKDDGLAQSWDGETWWCNPEFGDQLPRWTKKARFSTLHGEKPTAGVLLCPSRVDTDWWVKLTEGRAPARRGFTFAADAGSLRETYFVQETRVWWLRFAGLRVGVYHHDERLQFEGMESKGESAPFPTSLIILANNRWKAPKPMAADPSFVPFPRPPLTLGMPR